MVLRKVKVLVKSSVGLLVNKLRLTRITHSVNKASGQILRGDSALLIACLNHSKKCSKGWRSLKSALYPLPSCSNKTFHSDLDDGVNE